MNRKVIYSPGTALAYVVCSIESKQGPRLVYKDGMIHFVLSSVVDPIKETILIHSTVKASETWKL